jgi:hypothetical protein
MIKSALWHIEDLTPWDDLINQLQNARSSVEHTDYEVPSKAARFPSVDSAGLGTRKYREVAFVG